TLKVTSDAPHVFVFCHHPRWINGRYGSDWDKVHQRLVKAGNVKGVFGGHIHRMRYDPRDGIEYFALATVGGHQDGSVPEAGFLHCYDLVTVRSDRIERATLPLGAVMDPREITGRVSQEAPKLTDVEPDWLGEIQLGESGGYDGAIEFTITNPVDAYVEMEARLSASDRRWSFVPNHIHAKIAPGDSYRASIQIKRPARSLDGGLALPVLDLGFDYLTETARFAIPRREMLVPFDLSAIPMPPVPTQERVLSLAGGADCARVPDRNFDLPDGPFTLEAWVHPDRLLGRQGLLCKTESSEYGIFANRGELEFLVHLGGRYVGATAPAGTLLQAGRWSHVAGVFDGNEVRLYLNGVRVASTPGSGPRKRNDLDLVIGGDITGQNRSTATLDGKVDEVRLSRGARYDGALFSPKRRLEADQETVLLLHMDASLGLFLRGAKTSGATLEGNAALRGI
ncbi:MAG: LamG-like jellyroll fold domain-containing protein, partial [Planctomycetota bacterium]